MNITVPHMVRLEAGLLTIDKYLLSMVDRQTPRIRLIWAKLRSRKGLFTWKTASASPSKSC